MNLIFSKMMNKIVLYIFMSCNYLVTLGNASVVGDLYSKFYQNEYKVIMERSDIDYVNKSLGEASLVSFAYNRTIKANNVSFALYHDYEKNDIKVLFQAYKFLSNEYRVFPMHFQLDLCRAVNENIAGNAAVFKCGNLTSCPFSKNTKYFSCNNVVDETRYPPLVPTGRYKFELTLFTKTWTIFKGNTYVNIYRLLKPGQSG